MSSQPRVVVVTRATEYEALLARHGTRGQARFFLESRGQSIEPLEARHQVFHEALEVVLKGIPVRWRRARVERGDLDRFLFGPDDIVLPLGQDGLVANTAKYLEGQAVIGLNPDSRRYEGVLVKHPPEAGADLLRTAAAGRGRYEERTMVEARLDDGQVLRALNELYLGHRTHQSSRYRIAWGERSEEHSSSGVIVTTGTGATGWSRSIARNRITDVALPQPTDPRQAFFVREAWPSVATGTALTDGVIAAGQALTLTSHLDADGVIFGDGIEADSLEFLWGRQVEVGLAPTRLRLLQT